jgi:hypothetical protein
MVKGYILTMEAFLSLLVIVMLTSTLPILLARQESEFGSFVLLTDSFEVLEKGYHPSLASWVDTESLDQISGVVLSNYFTFIKDNTGKRIFIRYKSMSLPYYGCETGLNIKRFIVTETGAKKVYISICKD